VLARLQSSASSERARLDAIKTRHLLEHQARIELWRSMRAFLSDLLRSVPTIGDRPLVLKGNYGSRELDWDDLGSRAEFTLKLDSARYVEAAVVTHDAGPVWEVKIYKLGGYNQYPTAQVVRTTEILQELIIDKLSKDFPDQFA
jgi:hypothetical protein